MLEMSFLYVATVACQGALVYYIWDIYIRNEEILQECGNFTPLSPIFFHNMFSCFLLTHFIRLVKTGIIEKCEKKTIERNSQNVEHCGGKRQLF